MLDKDRKLGLLNEKDEGDGFFVQRQSTGTYKSEFDIESR